MEAYLDRSKHRICKYFQRTGRCDYGARCRFSHDLDHDLGPEPATDNNARIGRRQTLRSPIYDRLRIWKYSIPRNRQPATPLGSAKLEEFLSAALGLVTSGEIDIIQQTVEFLASDGGLARVDETITTTATYSSTEECLHNGNNVLLPLLSVLTHADVTQSFILEKSLGVIHNFFYGISGRRAYQWPLCSHIVLNGCAIPVITRSLFDGEIEGCGRSLDMSAQRC